MNARRSCLLAFLGLAALSASAKADSIPYPNAGTINTVTYTFTAASTGDVTAYIVGGFGAGYTNELGLLINGVDTGIQGLNNHTSSVGDSLVLGSAQAGDTLTFVLHNLSLQKDAYSDPSLNAAYDDPSYTGPHTHIYSAPYTATSPLFAGVPAGTYVAFEDQEFPFTDANYNDESFVFGNVREAPSTAVPLPSATWGGLGLLAAVVGVRFTRRKKLA